MTLQRDMYGPSMLLLGAGAGVLLLASLSGCQPGVTAMTESVIAPGESVSIRCTASPTPCPTVTVTVTPEPIPSPSVTVSATPAPSPSPKPSPSPAPSPRPTLTTLKGIVDEALTIGVQVPAEVTVESLQAPGLTVEAFEIMSVETVVPSCRAPDCAAPGLQPDPLFPMARLRPGVQYLLEVKARAPGTRSIPIGPDAIAVVTKAGPMPAAVIPFYAELQFANVSSAHGLADQGPTLAQRCALNKLYRDLLRAHGVEPIKQHIETYPRVASGFIDDAYLASSGCGYRQTVVDGAIATPFAFGPAPQLPPSPALLAAFQSSIVAGRLPAMIAYPFDEGQPDRDDEAFAAAQRVKVGSPLLTVLETRTPTARFASVVDLNVSNLALVTPGMQTQGGYASCMQNGNCQNRTDPATVGAARRQPMMVFDSLPLGLHARAQGWALDSAGIPLGLYFNTTQRLRTAWDRAGQYNEGGNGDGTLLYPGVGPRGTTPGMKGLTADIPIPSLRLKQLRRGLQDLQYLKLARARGIAFENPFKSPSDWPRDESRLEAVRLQIWDALP